VPAYFVRLLIEKAVLVSRSQTSSDRVGITSDEATPDSAVLASLSVGTMIQITPQFQDPLGVLDLRPQAVCLSPKGARNAVTFTITMYQYDGGQTAKASFVLGNSVSGKYFWAPGSGLATLVDPIVLAQGEPGQFVLTDESGTGNISIRNTSAPPPPYLGFETAGAPFPYLAYGESEDPLGSFTIAVVG
jgi:hypothetical protein